MSANGVDMRTVKRDVEGRRAQAGLGRQVVMVIVRPASGQKAEGEVLVT